MEKVNIGQSFGLPGEFSMFFCFLYVKAFHHCCKSCPFGDQEKKNICAPDETGYYTNQESIDLKCLEDQRKAYGCSYPTYSAGIF